MTSSRRQGRSLWVLGSSLLLACSEPPIDPAPHARATPRPLPRAPVAAAIELGTAPLALDERGVPHLLRGASAPAAPAATATESARQHVARLAPAWGVDQLPQLEPIGEVPVDGGAIARLRQSLDGIPIEGGELRVLVGRNGELTAVRGALYDATTPRTAARFLDDEAGAVARAVRHHYGAAMDPRALASHFAVDGTRRLAGRDGEIEVELATARKVWHRAGDALIAAWKVEAYTSRAGSTDGDAHATLIAADDGRVLAQRSLTADAAFRYRVFAETTGELHPFDGPTTDPVPHPTGVPDGSYPSYVPPRLVTVEGLNHPAGATAPDPWLPAGATETRGNNVDAYTDFNPPSGLSTGDFRATATSTGTFDRTYDTALGPMSSQSQQMAAVTSLFYVINWLHDFWYDAGFTEAAGNAQAQNYGRGGVEGDALLAEAQDNALGGSRNNANMSTPSDGMPPRMQVFLWSGPEERSLTLTPSNRTPAIDTAGFGPTSFDRTAQLILANDGTGNPSDACTALVGTYTGRIVLADRGSCTYENKALMVQNAGGAGLIVADNQANTTPPSLGDDSMITTPITIGAVSVTMAEGARIKTDLAAGAVQARIFRNSLPELDGALDSTLIAHEFGHYLHHRLSECNTTWCRAMSEGWGDFTALMLQLREGDDLAGAYPFSVYTTQSFSDDPGYFGIRRAPYSVDFAKNSLSYRHMAEGEPLPTHHPFLASGNNAEVHNAGEVWAAALWEAYVALQQAGPSFEAVRSKMARYVVAGLMMTPVDATPTETRDALLTVASEADRDLLAAAFARRGFGTCAITPARDSSNFVGIVESDQLGGRALTGQLALTDTVESCDHDGVLDGGETGVVSVPLTNTGLAPLPDVTVSVVSSTPGLTVLTPPVEIASFAAGATEQIPIEIRLDDSAAGPLAGELMVTVRAPGSCEELASFPLAVRLDVDDVPASAATDHFDAASVWTAAQTGTERWRHVRTTPLEGHWHADDLPGISDTQLVSPRLEVGATAPFVVSFKHRYGLELDGSTAYDAAVVELTTDNGATWRDVTELGADPGYTHTVFATSGNSLANRRAYSGTNPSNPGFDTVTLDFGTQLAGKTVRLRFRIGTDQAAGGPGWDLDDIAFSGIVGTPFPTQVADRGLCVPGPDGDGDGDGGCCDAGPLRTGQLGLALGVLALVLRRRRARGSAARQEVVKQPRLRGFASQPARGEIAAPCARERSRGVRPGRGARSRYARCSRGGSWRVQRNLSCLSSIRRSANLW